METTQPIQQAMQLIRTLPPHKLASALDYLEYLKSYEEDDYDLEDVNEAIKQGLKEVRDIEDGKIKPKDARELLNELQDMASSAI
ncbi:MAG: hypothetical protein QME81_10070 [bacterium]|nr:hypothetical protein [bacterium]